MTATPESRQPPPVQDGKAAEKPAFFLRLLGKVLMRLLGWRTAGVVPQQRKWVMTGYPHTSNWDFPFFLLIAWSMGFKASWLGKESLFTGPLGWLMRALGGVPVVRGQGSQQTEQVAAHFRAVDSLVLAIAPEGTRGPCTGWHTGFYHIAQAAGIPIQIGYLDYKNKIGGLGPLLWPSGDIDADLATVAPFLEPFTGKFPQNRGPVRVRVK